MMNAPGTTAFDGIAHMGTNACICCCCCCCWVVVVIGASPEETETPSFMSMYSLLAGLLRFFLTGGSSGVGSVVGADVVGILRVPFTDMAMAGTVPVPVAAMMAGSACSRSQRMVSPSDLWPSSRVN